MLWKLRYRQINTALIYLSEILSIFLLTDSLTSGRDKQIVQMDRIDTLRFRQWVFYQALSLIAYQSPRVAAWFLFGTLQFLALRVLNSNIREGPLDLIRAISSEGLAASLRRGKEIQTTVLVLLEISVLAVVNLVFYRLVVHKSFSKKTVAFQMMLSLLGLAFLTPQYPFVVRLEKNGWRESVNGNIYSNVGLAKDLLKREVDSIGAQTLRNMQELRFFEPLP